MKSRKWRMWYSLNDSRRCNECKELHGKIYSVYEKIRPKIPRHIRCRCLIMMLNALYAGTATGMGIDGADWWLKRVGILPNYYIDKETAGHLGWKAKHGNLHQIAPGQMIGGDIYLNKDGRLPNSPGRIWREADLDYVGGWRGEYRVLYSSDGLIFVTYDHYSTFIEIV